MTIRIDIERVQQLRQQAAQAMHIPDWQQAGPGWSLSLTSFEPVVGVFPSLRIKPGYRLVGYLYKDGLNGHGAVWAARVGGCDDIEVCQLAPYEARVRKYPIRAPRPPSAVDQFMMAIEGDRSPASFLSASLFARTIAEFGAVWHGIRWSHEQILGDEPPYCEASENPSAPGMPRRASSQRGITRWIEPKPDILEPVVKTAGDRAVVVMHTYSEFGNCHVCRITDRYDAEAYTFQTDRQTIAEGARGYVC